MPRSAGSRRRVRRDRRSTRHRPPTAGSAPTFTPSPVYRPRRPAETPPYRVVQRHLNTFLAQAEADEIRPPPSPRGRRHPGHLALDTSEVPLSAHVLTNIEGIHALTAWRRYNREAVIEQRIAERGQLSVGQTAIDDLDGNALLWGLGTLAYQLLHIVRTTALSGSWRTAQPKRLRLWLFRLPAKFTRHARKTYLQLLNGEPGRARLLLALRRISGLPPPTFA